MSATEELAILAGDAQGIKDANSLIWKIGTAPLQLNVLLIGETGTGKEVAARALHEVRHGDTPFFAVNCSLLQKELLRSELFGHLKGSFSGADKDKKGIIEIISQYGGTLFLDELADLDPSIQPGLLRLLEAWEYCPVGATENKKVTVKPLIVAAIQPQQLENRMREDLINRIAEVEIRLPTLTENSPKGISQIILKLLETIISEEGEHRTCPQSLIDRGNALLGNKKLLKDIAEHQWDGNVRALRSYLKQCLAFGGEVALPVPRSSSAVKQSDDLPLFARIPERLDDIVTAETIVSSYVTYVAEKFSEKTGSDLCNKLGMSLPTFRNKRQR